MFHSRNSGKIQSFVVRTLIQGYSLADDFALVAMSEDREVKECLFFFFFEAAFKNISIWKYLCPSYYNYRIHRLWWRLFFVASHLLFYCANFNWNKWYEIYSTMLRISYWSIFGRHNTRLRDAKWLRSVFRMEVRHPRSYLLLYKSMLRNLRVYIIPYQVYLKS